MANRAAVPKFGNWETEQNVPYTAYFDKARKGRSGTKIMNPNDPRENPDMFPKNPVNARAPPPKSKPEPNEPAGRGAGRTREEGIPRQFSDPPARNDNATRRVAANVSNEQRYGGRGARPAGRSAGQEQSSERAQVHQNERVYGRGTGIAPSLEGKNSYDSSHGTPTRPRMRPFTRGDESPDKGAAVPKFGEWDEKNPASADGYTHIFNKVREERQSGGGKVPDMNSDPSYNNAIRRPPANVAPKICCFPWAGK